MDAIEDALKAYEVTYVRVDGNVTGEMRSEAERKFQIGEAQIFLGQIDAACTSMNLQNSTISVTFDCTWSAANYAQFLGRTKRRGQEYETYHYDLVSNRLQEKIIKRVREGRKFDAASAEWIETKASLAELELHT